CRTILYSTKARIAELRLNLEEAEIVRFDIVAMNESKGNALHVFRALYNLFEFYNRVYSFTDNYEYYKRAVNTHSKLETIAQNHQNDSTMKRLTKMANAELMKHGGIKDRSKSITMFEELLEVYPTSLDIKMQLVELYFEDLGRDPTGEAKRIIDSYLDEIQNLITRYGLKIKYIVNTHYHFDHTLGNKVMAKSTGAKIMQHEASTLDHDITLVDGQKITFGNSELTVFHTPGHSKDSICLVGDGKIFSGDTLFVGNCGRVDLPGGSAKELYHSLFDVLYHLDETLILYPGHNYGTSATSTIGKENPVESVKRKIAEILSGFADAKIIVVTAYTDYKFEKAKASAIFTKPYDFEPFLDTVKKIALGQTQSAIIK
ncbi:hypothetical protein LCGC14_2928840, partial [marine sediment metagenome]